MLIMITRRAHHIPALDRMRGAGRMWVAFVGSSVGGRHVAVMPADLLINDSSHGECRLGSVACR
jgi:hypothetical protein